MNGTSIRNIKRNKSEKAVGMRCNRYGDNKLRKGRAAARLLIQQLSQAKSLATSPDCFR